MKLKLKPFYGLIAISLLAGGTAADAGGLRKPMKGYEATGPFMRDFGADPWSRSLLPAKQRWHLTGSGVEQYLAGTDRRVTRDGEPSSYLRSNTPGADGFASVMTRQRDVEELRGKRVRVGAWVRAEELTGIAGLWLRIERPNGPVMAIDNLRAKNPSGSTDWVWSEVVLDVPEDATEIAYGLGLNREGATWLNGLAFGRVDESVPTSELGL